MVVVVILASCSTGSLGPSDAADGTGNGDAFDLADRDEPPADEDGGLGSSDDAAVEDAGLDAAWEDAVSDGSDGWSDVADAEPQCPFSPCFVIDSFPYQHRYDTTYSSSDRFDSYGCAPGLGEKGPEVFYVFELRRSGTLVAMLDDGGDVGADIDIHLLEGPDSSACLSRGHVGLSRHLAPGVYFLVTDSFSDGGGEYPGPYTLYVHFLPDGSNCAMLAEPLRRIGTDELLQMPATGQVVKEAHLVTDQEFTDGSWPQSSTDRISEHYALSQSVTGYPMSRSEPWCPCCEPSNEYGQGSSVRPPVVAEGWYICMRWASAPPRGQRYLIFNGKNGRAVVAAAGYENGPGDLTRIGGACEEVHHWLGTAHLDFLTFGVAADQNLAYGPIECQE